MTNVVIYPVFDSSFLNDITIAFKKRSKSIKHNTSFFYLQKVIEKKESIEFEKLEVEFILQKTISVRLYFWEDRWAWIDVRDIRKKQWIFEWNTEGRIGLHQAKHVIQALKNSFLPIVAHKSQDLKKIWFKIMLTGPQP